MPGITVKEDIPDKLKAEVIAAEVLGLARPDYTLRQLTRVINMPGLRGAIPIATKLAGFEKVPPLVEAELSANAYTTVDFELWKNVVHVATSREAETISQINIMQQAVQDAAKDLARMENKQISEEFDGATAIAGTDWGAKTAGVSDNSPLEDIMGVAGVLAANGYMASHIAMDENVYAKLVANTQIVDAMQRGTLAVTGRIPAIAGLQILVDIEVTNNEAIVVAQKAPAFAMGSGPTWVEKYTGKAAFYDAYAIAKFIQPKLVLGDAVRRLTGVTT